MVIADYDGMIYVKDLPDQFLGQNNGKEALQFVKIFEKVITLFTLSAVDQNLLK